MSLLITAFLWFVLAVGVALLTAVGFGIGFGYGRLARNWSDERAVRGANVVTIGLAAVVGIAIWIVVDAGASVGATLEGDGIVTGVLAAASGGVAAGIVAAGTIDGITRRYDLPTTDESTPIGRHYFRYVAGLFVVVFLFVSLVGPALEAGALAIAGVLLAFLVGFWATSPFFRTVTMETRSPTDAERERLESVLEAVSLEPRSVRIVEGGEQHVSVELLGAPGSRVLFVGSGTLSALEDETLCGVFAARREQAAHYERVVATVVLVGAAVPLLAGISGTLSLAVGSATTTVLVLVGLAAVRRLRLYTDARAADRVGPTTLADAFERIASEAGYDLEASPDRDWLGTAPPLSVRIDRLRTDTDRDES